MLRANRKSINGWLVGLVGLVGTVAWLTTSCESVVELNLPPPRNVLVVNGVLNPDSVFRVALSASQSAYTSGPYPVIKNATVQLIQAGQPPTTLLPLDSGRYEAPTRPLAGQTYELRVAAATYPGISATATVPAPPALSQLRAVAVAPTADAPRGSVNASVVLDDPGAEENFYYLQAYTPAVSEFEDKRPYRKTVSLTFLAPIKPEFSMESR